MPAKDPTFLETIRKSPGRAFSKEAWEDAEAEASGRSRTAIFWMDPKDFLAAAVFGMDTRKEKHVQALVRDQTPLSSIPYLLIDNRGDGTAQVVGHEGRHRSMVLRDLGVQKIPVRITVRSGEHSFRWSVPSEGDDPVARPTQLIRESHSYSVEPKSGPRVPFPTQPAESPYRGPAGQIESCPCGESQDPEVWLREDHAEITTMIEGLRAQIKAGLWGKARTQFNLLVQELTLHFATEEASVFARLSSLRHLDAKGRKELARLRAQHAPFRRDMARIGKSPLLVGFLPFAARIEQHAREENALLLPPSVRRTLGGRDRGSEVELLPARSPGRIERDYGHGLAVLRAAGINLLPYEEPYEVFRVDGEVVGASTFGWKDDEAYGKVASFSVAVLPSHRRKGIARRLVQSLVRQHPGAHFETWVISEHMAALLEELGFSAESSRGWSPDSPYMALETPTRAQVRARKAAALLARKAAPPAPREANPGVEWASWFTGPVTLDHLFLPPNELEEARKLRVYYKEHPEERRQKIQTLLRGPSPIPGFTALSVPGRGSYWQIVLRVDPLGRDETRSERVSRLSRPTERLPAREDPLLSVFSRWASSDHTDREAARTLSKALGWDVWAFYQEPGVDPVFWDGEIEDQITRGRS